MLTNDRNDLPCFSIYKKYYIYEIFPFQLFHHQIIKCEIWCRVGHCMLVSVKQVISCYQQVALWYNRILDFRCVQARTLKPGTHQVGPRLLFFSRFNMLNWRRSSSDQSGHLIILIGCSDWRTSAERYFFLRRRRTGVLLGRRVLSVDFGLLGQL